MPKSFDALDIWCMIVLFVFLLAGLCAFANQGPKEGEEIDA